MHQKHTHHIKITITLYKKHTGGVQVQKVLILRVRTLFAILNKGYIPLLAKFEAERSYKKKNMFYLLMSNHENCKDTA